MDADSGTRCQPGMNPAFLALSRLRRRRYDECADLCTELLSKNNFDQQAWWMKMRALTLKAFIDDTEMEDEGIAEMLMDDNAMQAAPRPGTSLNRPTTTARLGTQSNRPMTSSGRPVTGFARPGTQTSRPMTGNRPGTMSMRQALQSRTGRVGTSRPVTSSGRFMRLGTASMLSQAGGPFIDIDRLDLRKYAHRPLLAKALLDYMLYCEHNPRKALELASFSTKAERFGDWWWKARLGKCYYQLGLLRDAERRFKSSLKDQVMIETVLELAKVYIRLDQPTQALEVYKKHLEEDLAGCLHLQLGVGRIYDGLNDLNSSIDFYKSALVADSSCVEAVACLGAHHFYNDQPEIALRFYRRLLQTGVNSAALWNNLGLCCFAAGQYDMTVVCYERALSLAGDDELPDIWYNIGQLALGIGDLGLAFQSFKVVTSMDSNHAEAYTNLGVLEMRRGALDTAMGNFRAAHIAPGLHEPLYNMALLSYRSGDYSESYKLVQKALEVCPDHGDSQELLKTVKAAFTSV